QTGIAGYTLIFNSYGLKLLAHTPFESKEKAIKENVDIHSQVNVFDLAGRRITVGETDTGKKLRETIDDLTKLVQAYQSGVLKEH
ncbi:MAG: fructose-bisphosphatase class III, partial [Clostridia bacterium]